VVTSKDEAAKQRAELANSMLLMGEQLAPVLDFADGMRADMERRGWSPTAAEQASLAWLMSMLDAIWKYQ